MAAMASDVMSSLCGPLKEENGTKEKEGVRVGERISDLPTSTTSYVFWNATMLCFGVTHLDFPVLQFKFRDY